MRKLVACLLGVALMACAGSARAFDPTGGPAWSKRDGWGFVGGLGGAWCGRDFCNVYLDVNLFGSFDGHVGVDYRFFPNLSVYGDVSTSYLNTDADSFQRDWDDDRGFLLTVVAGVAGHLPVMTWLDMYLGFGLGYGYLAFWGERDRLTPLDNQDYYLSHHGIEFEFRTGAHVYLFSQVPTLGLGLYFRIGIPAWITGCYEIEGVDSECGTLDELEEELEQFAALRNEPIAGSVFDDDDLPLPLQMGLEVRYGF